jgi:hypothetical protein
MLTFLIFYSSTTFLLIVSQPHIKKTINLTLTRSSAHNITLFGNIASYNSYMFRCSYRSNTSRIRTRITSRVSVTHFVSVNTQTRLHILITLLNIIVIEPCTSTFFFQWVQPDTLCSDLLHIPLYVLTYRTILIPKYDCQEERQYASGSHFNGNMYPLPPWYRGITWVVYVLLLELKSGLPYILYLKIFENIQKIALVFFLVYVSVIVSIYKGCSFLSYLLFLFY